MNWKYRWIARSIMVAVLLPFGVGYSVANAQDKIPVRLGLHAQTSWLMYAAKELKTFEKVGLEPTFIKFTVGVASIPAMQSRSVDIACPGITPFVAGLAQNVDWKIIGIDTELPDAEGFVARNGSGIDKLADFKGKNVAVAKGSTSDYGLVTALRKVDIDKGDVNILYMSPPQAMAAMLNKDIDAAAVWEPWMQKFSEEADAKVLGSEADFGIYTAVAVYAAHGELLKNNPEVARRFVRALKMAYDYIEKNGPEVAIKAVSEAIRLPEDVVANIYPKAPAPNVYRWSDPEYLYSVVPDGKFANNAADMVEYLASEEIIPRAVDIDAAFEPSIVKAVLGQQK